MNYMKFPENHWEKNDNIHFINKQPKIEVDQNPLKNQ